MPKTKGQLVQVPFKNGSWPYFASFKQCYWVPLRPFWALIDQKFWTVIRTVSMLSAA